MQDIYYIKQTLSRAIFSATKCWNSIEHLLHKTNPRWIIHTIKKDTQTGLSMMSQKKPQGICTRVYSQEIGKSTSNHINSSNMNRLKIQKVASSPAIPAGGFLGACSVTSMMVQTTSNENRTVIQVIKLHFWWFTPLVWHSF